MSDANKLTHMSGPRPVDRSRAARIVLAQLDNDRPRAEAAFQEAIDEGTLPELSSTQGGFVILLLRLLTKDNRDDMRQWAIDIIAKAQQDEEGE